MPSRVGAMPTPYQHPGRGGHGLSMDDLKKQTAVRLADEQQRHKGTDEEGTDSDSQSDPNAQSQTQSQAQQLLPVSQQSDTSSQNQFPQYYQQTMPPPLGLSPHPHPHPHRDHGEQRGQNHPNTNGFEPPPTSRPDLPLEDERSAAFHVDHKCRAPSQGGTLVMMTPTRGGGRSFQPRSPSPSIHSSTKDQANTPQRILHHPRTPREHQRPKQWEGMESPKPQRRHQHASPSPRRFDNRGAPPFTKSPHGRGAKLHQRNGGTAGSSSFDAAGSAPAASPSTNKLPHGLTVEELKEMTRARLAASSDSGSVSTVEEEFQRNQQQFTKRGGALPPQSFTPNRSRLGSSGSTGSRKRDTRLRHPQPLPPPYDIRQRTASMESTASAPPAVVHTMQHDRVGGTSFHRTFSHQGLSEHQTHMVGPDRGAVGAFHQGQMLNPPACHLGTPKGKHFAFAGGRESRQMESLETASVTSLSSAIGSEYLGSESASFPAGITRGPATGALDDAALSFNGSFSYPAGAGLGNAMDSPFPRQEMPAVNHGNSFFDPSIGAGMNRQRAATDPSGFGTASANRIRAATMSPPGLSHLMEHEPLNIAGTGRDELCIPTFDSVSPANQGASAPAHGLSAKITEFSTSPAGSRVSSPTNSRMGNSSSSGVFPSGGNLQDIFQRGPPTSALAAQSGDSLGNGNDVGTGNGPFSGVFRCVASFGGDEQSSRVPGRDLTMSSTASSGGAFFSDIDTRGESARILGTKSWGGPTCHDSQAAQTFQAPDDSLTTSMLGRDLNALLSFSDEPGNASEDGVHGRAPSLVSKIDPELKNYEMSGNNSVPTPSPGQSVLSTDDPVLPISDQGRGSGCGGAIRQL